jgi:cytochrome c-type biogenesis protein CcmE
MYLTRVTLAVPLILGSIAFLAVREFNANKEFYLTVDELRDRIESQPELADKTLRLRGQVDETSVRRSPDGLRMDFELIGKDATIPVQYEGTVPDTFDLAHEVTVSGTYRPHGMFEAKQLLVQCPSKYEAELQPPGGGLP